MTQFGRLVNGIDTGNRSELDECVPEMPFDGCLCEAQSSQSEHFTFTGRKRAERWSLLICPGFPLKRRGQSVGEAV